VPAHGTAGPRGSVRACPAPDEGTHFVSRLWSRFGVRTAAIALLSVGVAGGVFLGEDRETQQEGIKAHQAAEIADQEIQLQREREFDQTILMAEKQEMREQARLRAAKIAKEEAERTRKAEAAAAARKQRVAEEKAAAKAAEEAKKKAAKPYDGPIPESCNEYSGNRRTGCALMIDYGFGIDQFPCLEKLWTKESGWNHQAENSYSGAYGIPQALPGSKMGSAGDDWQSNPATQIKWGLGYIKGRYNTPCGAWNYFLNNGSY